MVLHDHRLAGMMGIVLALSGTLGRDTGLYEAAARELFRELAAENAFAPADERLLSAAVDDVASTARTDHAAVTRLVPFLREGVMSASTLTARYRMTAMGLAPQYFRPFDDVRAPLDELERLRVPQAVLCEGWSGIEHAKAAAVGYSGKVITDEDVPGGDARSLSAFADVAERLRLSADRIWFVGADARRDIAPARAAGFQTVWVNREAAALPSGALPPDHAIGSLPELLELLGEPYTHAALTLRTIFRRTLDFRAGHYIPFDPLSDE